MVVILLTRTSCVLHVCVSLPFYVFGTMWIVSNHCFFVYSLGPTNNGFERMIDTLSCN